MYTIPSEVPTVSGIYSLSCPDSGKVCYIGQAKNIRRRFSSHVGLKNKPHLPCSRWIKSLLEQGKSPVLNVVEVTDSLDDSEKKWISFYGIEKLYNLTPGGSDSRFSTYAGAKMPWGKMQSPAHYLLIQLRTIANESYNEDLKSRADMVYDFHEEMRDKGLKAWVWYNINLVAKVPMLSERYSGKMSRKAAEEILING